MFKFTNVLIRRTQSKVTLNAIFRFNSNVASTELKPSPESTDSTLHASTNKTTTAANIPIKSTNHIVTAAFASLKDTANDSLGIQTPFIDKRITSAKTVDELLSISSEGSGISRRHALKVVSVLASWSTNDKVKLSDFETDPRFLKLCKILARLNNFHTINKVKSRSEDLSMILSVTADDEAAKLVATITLPQMVKVMSSLAYKHRRSLMLLRSLAFNITRCNGALDIKQCADLLYSVAHLNFFDENLLQRITYDISSCLEKNVNRSAVVGSILTSLGLLKYKDSVLLDTLSDWMLKNHDICRPQDMFAFFLTLAVLNHTPANWEQIFNVMVPQLKREEAVKSSVWIEFVWSLVLLNKVNNEHLESVLSEDFLNQIPEISNDTSSKLRLLNINAYAMNLKPDYKGPTISEDSFIKSTDLLRSKEKVEIINSMVESLKNLVQSEEYLKTDVNKGMGFYIDADCGFDKKCNPVALDKIKTTPDAIRVAIIAQDYHDMLKGRQEPTGVHLLIAQLLKEQGYQLLRIPYTEFNPRDKLVNRVQYLETKLKALVKQPPT